MAGYGNTPGRAHTTGTIDDILTSYYEDVTPAYRDKFSPTEVQPVKRSDLVDGSKEAEFIEAQRVFEEACAEFARGCAEKNAALSNASVSIDQLSVDSGSTESIPRRLNIVGQPLIASGTTELMPRGSDSDGLPSAPYRSTASTSSASGRQAGIPMAKPAARRMPLSSSEGSNGSDRARGPPMVQAASGIMVAAANLMLVSDSEGSSSSEQSSIPVSAFHPMLFSSTQGSGPSMVELAARMMEAAALLGEAPAHRMATSGFGESGSSQEAAEIPMAKVAARRMQLSSSEGSNGSHPSLGLPPMAKVATQRMQLSSSEGSSDSQPSAGPPMAKAAARRMQLSSSEGSNGSQPLIELPMAKLGIHRAPPTVSGETVLSRSPMSAKSITTPLELSTKQVLLEIDVKLRLMPAIYTLSKSELSSGSRLGARKVVHDTLNFVRQCNGSDALMARCNFYIGVSLYVPGDAVGIREALVYFERAKLAAAGGYAEGEWAVQWLNYHKSKSLGRPTLDRQASVMSWVSEKIGGIWGYARSGGSGSFSTQFPKIRSGDNSVSPTGFDKRPVQGERIPSFTTMDSQASFASKATSVEEIPGKETSTKDHYGLQWSPNSHFGKNDIVSSPGAMSDIDEGSEPEQHIPHNIHGGFVHANNLAPAIAKSPTSPSARRKSYIPAGIDPPSPARVLCIRNIASPLPSPQSLSPHSSNMSSYFNDFSGTHAVPSSNSSLARPTGISSSHSDRVVEMRAHKRQKSVSFEPAVSPTQEVQPEPANPVAGGPQQPQQKRRMGSLSMITTGIATGIASGLEVAGALPHRRRSELAREMEEGESPGFAPKASEVSMYRRRESDIIEEV